MEQIKLLSSKNDDLRAEKARSDDRVRQLTEEVKYKIKISFNINDSIVTNYLFLFRLKNGKVNMKKVDWNYVH